MRDRFQAYIHGEFDLVHKNYLNEITVRLDSDGLLCNFRINVKEICALKFHGSSYNTH